MTKLISINQAITISNQLREQGKRIVLAGGCFDILHLGHVSFLEKAKQHGDVLLVWVESDETIKRSKGAERPIHTQRERAMVLAALSMVDYVVLLPHFSTNQQYDDLVKQLKPAIIAATKGDPEVIHKKRTAKLVDAKVVYVTKRIPDKSSSSLAQRIAQEA